MARYDKSTKDFMTALEAKDGETEGDRKGELFARKAMSIARSMSTAKNPTAAALTMAARGLTGKGVDQLLTLDSPFQKTGSMKPKQVFTYLNKKYKDTWFDWEPETIWRTLKEDENIEATDEVKNLIQAFQVLTNTNFAHESWQVFENVANAINQNIVNFAEVQPLEVNEISLALKVINMIRPKKQQEDDIWRKIPDHARPQQGFDDEVWGYIAAAAKNAGLVLLPPELFGGSGSPQNILDNTLGNNIDLKNKVSAKWYAGVKAASPIEVDIQLARLTEIKDYVEEHYG